jgi:hypothetical protein
MLSVMATMFNTDSCRTNKKNQALWDLTVFTMASLHLNVEKLQFRAAIMKMLELLADLYMTDCIYVTEVSEATLGPDHTTSRAAIKLHSFTATFRCVIIMIVKTVT